MDPIIKINALKYSTSTNVKVGSNVKFLIIDLRLNKKLKIKSSLKKPVVEVDPGSTKEYI